jgi:DNA replication ATP-dependent helicase Dna2
MLMELAEKYPDAIAQLTMQYRMHKDICELSNVIAYGGKLKCANYAVASRTLNVNAFRFDALAKLERWLQKTIDPSNAVVFVDTDNSVFASNGSESFESLEHTIDSRIGGSIVNRTEAQVVQLIVDNMLKCGIKPSTIGVICPFRAQLRILNEQNKFGPIEKSSVEISTIDRFQGRDKDVIIISFVRSNAKGKVGKLLQDYRRLNVASSRAKCKLIMIGSFSTLHKGSDVLQRVLEVIRKNEWIVKLPNDAIDREVQSAIIEV